jgi:Kef-type K+ transport system membrane component KefB
MRARGRQIITYVTILVIGAAVLAVVLPLGGDITAAPQGPALGAVDGEGRACLGDRIALVQSGVYADFYVAGANGGVPGEELGAAIAHGEIDRRTGQGSLDGSCAPATPLAGQSFVWNAEFERAEQRVRGTIAVTGTALDVDVQRAGAETPSSHGLTGNDLAGRIFLAVAIVIAAARVVGGLFSRIHQPRVVGEIVAGIVLGPSLLGVWWPEAIRYLFPPEVTSVLRVMAQFGLILFMFIIGLELDHKLLRGSSHTAVLISHVSIVLPFSLGVVASLAIYPIVGSGRFTGFALFMGAAMAITAFPVLARILTDTGLHRTRLGTVAIVCAAVDDITAWCVLAVVVAVVKTNGAADAVQTIGLAVGFVAVMFVVVRPMLRRLATVHEARGVLNPPVLAGILVGVFLTAWATEAIGIHAIFGAFVAGAIMPRSKALADEITGKLEDVTVVFLLPIFFAVVGLSTRFGLLDDARLWLLAASIILIAVAGKLGGSIVAARADGQGWRFSVGLGLLMNTRGLTEIVILTIGRSLGVISPALFTIMVLMALVTTIMATPLLHVFYPRHLIDRETARRRAVERLAQPGQPYQRIVVAVRNPEADSPLIDIAMAFGGPETPRPTIVLVHVIPPPGREEVRANLGALVDAEQRALDLLAPLRAQLDAVGVTHECITRVGNPAVEVPAIARSLDVDLVVLGAHQAYVGQNPLGGVVADVLAGVPCDVGVLVRAGAIRDGDAPLAVFVGGTLVDLGVLEAATALARGLDARLRVVHPAGTTVPDLAIPVESVALAAPDGPSIVAAAGDVRLVIVALPPERGGARVQLVERTDLPLLVLAVRDRGVVPEHPPVSTRREASVNVSGEQRGVS